MGRSIQNYLVIDTGIWIKGLKNSEYMPEAYKVLLSLSKEETGMAVDNNGIILREYRDNFPRGCAEKRNFELRIINLYGSQKVLHVDSELTDTIKRDLKQAKFHEEEDWTFVGTALNASKIIVSEDSDYGIKGEKGHERAYQYLTEELNINLFSAKSYLDWNGDANVC